MSELPKAGECYDRRGIPIYPGDLLRSFHFIGPRRKRYYLYHVAVADKQTGAMRAVPASYLAPSVRQTGGVFWLHDDAACQCEIIDGMTQGKAMLFDERQRKR